MIALTSSRQRISPSSPRTSTPMRIISGTHRSRKILEPQSDRVTRPITDRVKQSLFDRLWSMEMLEAGSVLDLFTGTGSLGLEALSRGMDHCTFVEQDRSASSLLEQNLTNLKLTDQAMVLKVDALSVYWASLLPKHPLKVVFCDPPYQMTRQPDSMQRLKEMIVALTPLVQADGVLVLRTDHHTEPGPISLWVGPETYAYGSMAVHFYQPKNPSPPESS